MSKILFFVLINLSFELSLASADTVLCTKLSDKSPNMEYICTDGTYDFYDKALFIGRDNSQCYLSVEEKSRPQDVYISGYYYSYAWLVAANQNKVKMTLIYYPDGYEQAAFNSIEIDGGAALGGFRRATVDLNSIKPCSSLLETGIVK